MLAAHFQGLRAQTVKPQLEPGQLAQLFPSEAPSEPQDWSAILAAIGTKILPGVTHWQHPRFLGYYPASSSLPAVLSELIIAALGSVGLQWSANPIGTELECVVMDWIARMIHIDQSSPFLHKSGRGGGLIQNTAGDALVAVMVAARIWKHHQIQAYDNALPLGAGEREALFYADSSRLVVYASDQTHFSGPKAVRVAGMRLHTLPAQRLADGNYGITAQQVMDAMGADRAQGLIPCCVQLNFGSTNTCGSDDLASFAGFADAARVWVHVDAAYAGASLILPQFKERAQQLQAIATSFNFNGSKWFLCGFDSAFLYVRDRHLLKDVFAATGDYLDVVQGEDIYNPEFKDWAVPLGRRFRALRIWAVIEYFGIKGIQAFLSAALEQADWLRRHIRASQHYELLVETDLGLVCMKLKESAPMSTEEVIAHLQSTAGGSFLVYPSLLGGQPFIRVAIGGTQTTQRDIEEFWKACLKWDRPCA